MRISLRTFFIVCIIGGVLVAWGAREYQLSIPSRFPVTYSTTPILDHGVPAEVLVWRKRSVRRATFAAESAHDQRLREWYPTDDDVRDKLLSDPGSVYFLDEQTRKVILEHRELFLSKKPRWLSKQSDHRTVVSAANVLAVLDDRSGFDLAINRLPQIVSDPKGLGLVQTLGYGCPKDWAIESKELMQVTREFFDKDPGSNRVLAEILERSGDKQSALKFHLIEAGNPEAVYYRTPSLKWLAKNAPTDEVFAMIKKEFSSAEILTDHDAGKLLEAYLQSENPKWRAEAFELAMQLNKTPEGQRGGYPVYEYYRMVCAHGGEKYLDDFKQHVEDEHCEYSMRALGRLLPREEYLTKLRDKGFPALYLEEEGDRAIPFIREQFLQGKLGVHLLAEYQAGTKDIQTIAAIQEMLATETEFYGVIRLVDALELLGADVDRKRWISATQPPAYDRTEPYATQTHWLANQITNEDFLKFVNEFAVKSGRTPITIDEVFEMQEVPADERGVGRTMACKIMAASGIAKEIVVDNYDFDSVGVVAQELSELFAGDLQFSSVSYAKPFLRFAASRCVFEVALDDTSSWCDPVAITDVLNSILERYSDSPKRLYCFDMAYDWCYVTIAYLDESFVEELGEKYAVYPFETKRVRLKDQSNK